MTLGIIVHINVQCPFLQCLIFYGERDNSFTKAFFDKCCNSHPMSPTLSLFDKAYERYSSLTTHLNHVCFVFSIGESFISTYIRISYYGREFIVCQKSHRCCLYVSDQSCPNFHETRVFPHVLSLRRL